MVVLAEDELAGVVEHATDMAYGALISNSSKVLLIDPSGETRQFVESLAPSKLTSTSFKDFSLLHLAEMRPDIVVTPLLTATFDILDVGALLTLSGFEGRIIAITPPLPNLASVVGEIRDQLAHIDFRVVISQPA